MVGNGQIQICGQIVQFFIGVCRVQIMGQGNQSPHHTRQDDISIY